MSKTLGQVAYEAHQRVAGFAAHWDANEREAWQAAAEAVAEAIHMDTRSVDPKEIAVIEAAKNKVTQWHEVGDFDSDSCTDIALIEAIEALQEVEGE